MTSEFSVTFSGAGGHSHDGISSTRIDTTSYSIFDFRTGVIGNNASRTALQQVNKISFDNYIIDLLNTKEFSPTLIKIKPNTLTGKILVQGTLTTDKLETNMVLAKQQIQSDNFNGVIDKNQNITSSGTTGWAITSTGQSVFNNVKVRGSSELGGWKIDGDSIINATENTAGYNKYIKLDPIEGIESTSYTGSAWGSGFYSSVFINTSGVSGIDVSGDADGEQTTRIRSSFIDSKYITATTQLRSEGTLGIGSYENESANTFVNAVGVYASSAGFLTIARNSLCLVLNGTATGTGSVQVAEFRRRGVQPGTSGIFVSNTAVAYSTTSDYRLKTNIQQIPESLNLLDKLNPVKFDWINSEEKNIYGFLAHELQEVVPYAVMGEKDAKDEDGNDKYQSIDGTFVVPVLTAALKEAVMKIDELEARVQALEGV